MQRTPPPNVVNFASLALEQMTVVNPTVNTFQYQMPLKTRFIYLIVAWSIPGIVYIMTSFVSGDVWIVPESFAEQLIPFNPVGIWLYLAFYLYIPYTFLTVDETKIRQLCHCFLLIAAVSGIVFFLLPSSIFFPDFETKSIHSHLLKFVTINDTEQNCFPSLHGSLITVCTLANWNGSRKLRTYTCLLLTILMMYSIIQIRRHVFIDLLSGVSLAVIIWFAHHLVSNRVA